jgi:transposase
MERAQVKVLWESMRLQLNEMQRRQYAATLAIAYGYGGATVVHEITGVSLNTITAGKKELEKKSDAGPGRVRKKGGGPKRLEEKYPDIKERVKELVDASTYGNPEKVLSWTTESLRSIQKALAEKYRMSASHQTVSAILESLGYSKQANQKMLQTGKPHPDRNAQFEYINEKAKGFIENGEPVISVDTKKKENIGNFKNPGQEYRHGKDPRKVMDHDFPVKELGKISPYGVYNLNHNTGCVNVGPSRDTAEFAVDSISRWWEAVGKHTFPGATKLMITCDCGGSNGYKTRLWKYQLSQLAKRIGLEIHVSHFPPGTSKWNKVEHRLFCYISKTWQGKPLVSIEAAINLIGSTTTTAGLKVICQRDDTMYELAKTVSDEDFDSIDIDRIEPFGNWNYILKTI